jgi:hypothetical protein
MVRNFLSGLTEIYPHGTPYDTRDGVRMGLEVCADLWHMNNISGPLLSFKGAGDSGRAMSRQARRRRWPPRSRR